jgi:hypothetical protein
MINYYTERTLYNAIFALSQIAPSEDLSLFKASFPVIAAG